MFVGYCWRRALSVVLLALILMTEIYKVEARARLPDNDLNLEYTRSKRRREVQNTDDLYYCEDNGKNDPSVLHALPQLKIEHRN